MLLAVNIGNTNIRFGVFKPGGEILSWTFNTKPYLTEDEFFAKFKGMYEPFGLNITEITEIAIGSVVPALTIPVSSTLKKIHKAEPVVVDRNSPSNVKHNSKQMGTDLYANAVAAQSFYKGKKIIIDFGTALTFTSVDENGKVLGVVISPGVITALKSLIGETAQLPEIELKAPQKVLGNDTESCMQSGMVYGFLSLAEGMIDRINKEVGEDCFVIATGGMSFIYAPLTPKIQVQDALHTIKGIAELYKLNAK
jgi:type III pantothenate kinase